MSGIFHRSAALVVALAMTAIVISPRPAAASQPKQPTTWVLASPSEFRLPPPPGEDRTQDELRRLRRIQRYRTGAKEQAVRFWNGARPSLRWTKVALRQIVIHRPGAFATRAARALSVLHIGLYEAFVAARDSRQTYHRTRPATADDRIDPLLRVHGSSYPDPNSAMAGAAERLLPYLFPEEPPETFERMAKEAVRSRLWAGVNYPTDVWRARRLGHKVAERVIARAETDGYKAIWDFEDDRVCSTPSCSGEDEAYWVPTPPVFQYPPSDPMVSRWDPWLLETSDEFRPSSPPAAGSDRFFDELAAVKAANDTSSDEDLALAFYWDDGPGSTSPAGHWNEIATSLVRTTDMRSFRTLKLFAFMNAAITDAFIAAWDSKYHYWSMRPVTAIRSETVAGVPNPLYEAGWTPNIPTPAFPSYVSGHATESAAAARVLQFFFPDGKKISVEESSSPDPLGVIDRVADQVAHSRLVGGIHFPVDNDAALVLGRQIGGRAIERKS